MNGTVKFVLQTLWDNHKDKINQENVVDGISWTTLKNACEDCGIKTQEDKPEEKIDLNKTIEKLVKRTGIDIITAKFILSETGNNVEAAVDLYRRKYMRMR